jgi:hypothetical protein
VGLASTTLAALVIQSYSGAGTPFGVRYDATLGAGVTQTLDALTRPTVLGYAQTLLLTGGWLALLTPLALLPAVPSLAMNALSTSPWMAAGKAHYSGLVLPIIVIAAAAALRRLRSFPQMTTLGSAALVLTSLVAYVQQGAGPLAANFAPASLSDHAVKAQSIAASLPAEAAVSGSSTIVPRVSDRPRVYVFPAVLDADYVFLDLKASPAPTSAGDVFLRVQDLLSSGGWQLESADDGLLLLRRTANAEATTPQLDPLAQRRIPVAVAESRASADLMSAQLVPSPDGNFDVDGSRWILRTTWRTDAPLQVGTRLEFWVDLKTGEQLHSWDVADIWWNPPERWGPGETVTVDVPDIPIRQFASWHVMWSST